MPDVHWISFHIHYCADPSELLCDCIGPIVQSICNEGLAEQFFYIRYGEGGPHVRLRLQVARPMVDIVSGRVRSAVEQWLAQKPAPAPDRVECRNNQVISVTYEPETERYGGPAGLPIAEHLFFCSSALALRLLARTGSAAQLRLGAAAEAMAAVLAAICANAEIIRLFLRRYVTSAMEQLEGQSPAHFDAGVPGAAAVALWQRFLKPRGEEPNKSWSFIWAAEVAKSMQELQRANVITAPIPVEADRIDDTLFRIAASQIHLLNNRLGLDVEDEMKLAAMLVSALPMTTTNKPVNGLDHPNG